MKTILALFILVVGLRISAQMQYVPAGERAVTNSFSAVLLENTNAFMTRALVFRGTNKTQVVTRHLTVRTGAIGEGFKPHSLTLTNQTTNSFFEIPPNGFVQIYPPGGFPNGAYLTNGPGVLRVTRTNL